MYRQAFVNSLASSASSTSSRIICGAISANSFVARSTASSEQPDTIWGSSLSSRIA